MRRNGRIDEIHGPGGPAATCLLLAATMSGRQNRRAGCRRRWVPVAASTLAANRTRSSAAVSLTAAVDERYGNTAF
jgi:hypothetical protein